MTNKIIVIACQSCGYLMKDIITSYLMNGYEVTLLTSKGFQKNNLSVGVVGLKTETVIAYDKSSSFKRLLTWMICAVQMWWKIKRHHQGEKVLYVSNPPLGPLLPLWLKNRFSLLIWDIYPDVLVNQHVVGDGNVIVKWWRNTNRKVYGRAECVYTISEGMKQCLSQYVSEDRIKVVPLWLDLSNIRRIQKGENEFLKKYGIEGKFVVMYSGNLGNTHRMDVLIDVAKRADDKDIVFVIIGEGGKKRLIEQRIKEEQVAGKVLLLPYQPYDFLSHSLSAADIAVVTLDTESSAMSVPSKTFNMMSLGAPLLCIASPESELGNIVRKYDVGRIFLPENVDGITEFVVSLKRDEALRKQYSKNSLMASRHFSVENAKMFVE